MLYLKCIIVQFILRDENQGSGNRTLFWGKARRQLDLRLKKMKGMFIMTKSRKLFAALTAAAMVTASVPASLISVSASAATAYDDDEIVAYSMFETNSSAEAQEKLEKAIEKAAKKDIGEITYGDLAKITSLNLSKMGLEGIPKAIEYMARLRTLNLSGNLLRSADANAVDLTGCINLTSLDISNNYLTSVPSWYVSMDITTKKIDNNLINNKNQRSIVATPAVYYFMKGDEVNENALKNKILSSVKLSDGTALPKFFYDPEYPPYDEDEIESTDIIDDRYYDLVIDEWDLSKYIKTVDDKHVVSIEKAANVDVTIRLYAGTGSSNNVNTNTTVKIYFLDGDDPSSVKVRLETLIKECNTYTKENYTSTSWNSFSAALKTATAIYGYENADADMMLDALKDLEIAKKGLINGVSQSTKKVLTDLITISKNFKEADYTAQSWAKFAQAVAMLTEAANNSDASVTQANNAIKAYQEAQAGLVATSLSVPATAPKTDFDAIYGENKTAVYTGTTREGYKYTWTFNGKDITEPKDLNPEIKCESAYDDLIRYEVGSASDYQIVSFAHKGSFPGKATVTIDVSAKYKDGTYRLYQWDASAKKSALYGDVTVKGGIATMTVTEGGDYFISSVLQNFEMISNNFKIDHSKLTIRGAYKTAYTVAAFKNSLQNGSAVTVLNADGTAATDADKLATGMTATAANSDVSYTIVVPGDVDGDGDITALDAMMVLRAVVRDLTLTYPQMLAADVTDDTWIYPEDAISILKYSFGIEE